MTMTTPDTHRSTTSGKRKLEDPTTSFQTSQPNKSSKLRNGSTPHSIARNEHYNASVRSEEEELEEDDIEAGPTVPNDDEEEENDVEEDEEGRFFGGGVTKQERDVMNFVDQNEAGDVEETIDLSWLKRTALNFERKINKNAELRAKYEGEPMKFVASEADLDTEIKSLSILSEHPELYQDLARSGCAESLVGLLAHENTDIAISVCEVIAELTDEDSEAEETQWNALVQALLMADIADLLVSNLRRLDESNDNDRSGVYYILNVLENLLSNRKNSEQLGKNSKLFKWLISRIQKPDHEFHGNVGQNRQYSAEILAILLQNNDKNVSALTKIGGVDTLLQEVATWRKRDPEKDSDEEEFAENLFDCLISVVRNVPGSDSFIEGEGIELAVIMLKEGKFSRQSALRLLDHAASGSNSIAVSERLVESGALKPLFTIFSKNKKGERQVIEHLLGLFASMLKSLPADTAPRIRLLAKFVEKNYEKITRLIELRKEYIMHVENVEVTFEREKSSRTDSTEEELEDELLSRRMDAGLFSLQTIDVILGWLSAEDHGSRKEIDSALSEDGGLVVIQKSLTNQLRNMDEESNEANLEMREMLQALIQCL